MERMFTPSLAPGYSASRPGPFIALAVDLTLALGILAVVLSP